MQKGWHKKSFISARFHIWRNGLRRVGGIRYGYYFWGDENGYCTVRKSFFYNTFSGYEILYRGDPNQQKMAEGEK